MNRVFPSHLRLSPALTQSRFTIPAIISCLLLLSLGVAVYFTQIGYGALNDTYRMLATWENLILNGDYVQSRQPGHLVPELIIGFASSLFGYSSSNIVSLLLSVLSLTLLYFLVKDKLGSLSTMVAITFIATNPNWILISSSSRDEIYAVFFFLLGIYLFRTDLWSLACLSLAMSTSSRIEYGPICLLAIFWFNVGDHQKNYRKVSNIVICYLLMTGLFFIPSYLSHHLTMNFLTGASAPFGGFSGNLPRFFYKLTMLYGLLGSIAVAWLMVEGIYKTAKEKSFDEFLSNKFNLFMIIIAIYFLVLSLIKPGKVTYLIPVLVATPLFFMNWRGPVRGLLVCCVLSVSYWFVSPDLLEIHRATQGVGGRDTASGASFEPQIKAGALYDDASLRSRYEEFFFKRFGLRDPRELIRSDVVKERRKGSKGINNVVEYDKPSRIMPSVPK